MKVRKAAAWAVVGAVLPLMADVASDPYSDAGVARSWLRGAGKLGVLGMIVWAFRVVQGDELAAEQAGE